MNYYSPYFSFSFEGILWQQFIDEAENTLVCEIRNPKTRTVSFIGIDLSTAKIRYQLQPDFETWWIGLSTVKDGILYLHAYQEDEPGYKALYALNSKSNTLIWEIDTPISFEKWSGDFLLCTKQQEREQEQEGEKKSRYAAVLINAKTGLISPLENIDSNKIEEINIKSPYLYLEGEPYFKEVATFLSTICSNTPIACMEYLESNQRVMISYYIYGEKNTLSNYLLIMDTSGNICWHDVLCKDLKGVGSGTYFVWNNKLISIINKNTSFAITL